MARGGKLKAAELVSLRQIEKRHSDGAGLYFVVSSPGSAHWIYRYMTAGVQKEMGLGPYPAVGLARAREKAQAAGALRSENIDPLDHKRRIDTESRLQTSRAQTFRYCADQYFQSHSITWKSEVYRANWLQQMGDYVYPLIGDLLVGDVGRKEVLAVLMQKVGQARERQPLWVARRETARRVRNRIENILDAAAAIELRSTENPARLNVLKPLLPKAAGKVKHHGALDYEKVPAFYAKLRRTKGTPARALEWTILTAARTNETLGARWSEIDLDAGVWTIPAERMKASVLHRVPLSKTAVSVLTRISGSDRARRVDYVFQGASKGSPLSNMTMLGLTKRLGGNELTTHGFRATFRGWAANRTRFGVDVQEAALAHKEGNATIAAYHRTDLFEKRIPLMRRWAIYLRTDLRRQRSAKPDN
ncbi:MAG: tyrosine-type recombinase/integrase [Phenylobacterium sp.]|uniref:tyrosine-type recombinase/integrase n=1 Tax=Phenylobacterium sp. TaxID=1871053 RepID=UPI0027232A1B|nr:integrase arm-type DNA-binding domain-containing protein [Phenylobacterium sp.]MDO8910687.1 tyrosine-type recombinase/integrase [Phenylobacterium sp.]MDP3099041.1 tyrosine-type recombinase/integrase [Phenylobacterium sp.]